MIDWSGTKNFDSILSIEKKSMKSKKSINKNKINLKVEACVHVHYDIYQSYKTYLNTNSFEYIQMYLLVVFTHILNTVDKIYARLEDPLFPFVLNLLNF